MKSLIYTYMIYVNVERTAGQYTMTSFLYSYEIHSPWGIGQRMENPS